MGKIVLILIAVSLGCLGMGGTTGTFGPAITETDRLFRAQVVDKSNKSFEVQNVTVDGSTYLPAMAGSAEASIDFGKISVARFYVQDDRVLVRVTLVNQEEMDFFVQPGTRFVGRTEWGRISLRAGDIKEISFK